MQLKSIKYPSDLKQCSLKQLNSISKELRKYIIDVISSNEGHLGASLGVVELTILLHYVFDTPIDKILWDVGHQAYGHKILTGRYEEFKSNRKWKGISGFPKIKESIYDSFGTGHAGTTISAALGMALASEINGEKNVNHISVIGDASIASGMAFEALNHLGNTSANVLVILNDNTMGIDPSVGALKNYLEKSNLQSNKNNNIFNSLNIDYYGPVDGHDMESLQKELILQKTKKGPRLLHVRTIKGKGLTLAEDDQILYHAPGKFDKITGKLYKKNKTKRLKYQQVFGKTILDLAKINSKIVCITPAMPTGSGINEMMKKIPERCYDVGIAEQHAVTLSAGMSCEGLIPFCVIYSTFLQRAYDQIIHDVAIQNLNIIFCIDRAGIVGHDGPTHHGVYDISFLRCIPNLTIVAPRNAQRLRDFLYTFQLRPHGPIAIRYPRGYSQIEKVNESFEDLNLYRAYKIKSGKTIAVLSLGTLFENVEEAINNSDFSEEFSHYSFEFVYPLDKKTLNDVFNNYSSVITIEEGAIKGGFGSALMEFAQTNNYMKKIKSLGVPHEFITHGDPDILYESINLSSNKIQKQIEEVLSSKK
ncbi:MAG: 1-deoxy-D-xylulose-5-phosphate synthase [Flavobacteriaceae bacterium]|nr:1-deoxy-D-xylulose-5-phosphate synthase [Flavobacteriaceae bacterium]